jgi:hypothetical protein
VRSLTQIKLGDVALPFEEAGHLERLKPHNSLLASPQLLREALDRDGYLYIKGLHDRQEVASPLCVAMGAAAAAVAVGTGGVSLCSLIAGLSLPTACCPGA